MTPETQVKHVVSSWVLSAGLRGLAKTCVETPSTFVNGVADGGCLGELVCGERIADRVLRRMAGATEVERSQAVYVFGGGTAATKRTWRVTFFAAGRKVVASLDVVAGTLPLLVGRPLMRRMGAQENYETGQLWVKVGDEYAEWGVTGCDGLMTVRLGAKANVTPVLVGTVGEVKSNQRVTEDPPSSGTTEVESSPIAEESDDEGWGDWEGGDDLDGGSEKANADGDDCEVGDNGAWQTQRAKKGARSRAHARAAGPSEKPVGNRFAGLELDGDDQPDDEPRDATVKKHMEEQKTGLKDVPTTKKALKVLSMGMSELTKVHSHGHRSVRALLDFLLRGFTRGMRKTYTTEIEELEARIRQVRGNCKGCNLTEPKTTPATKVPQKFPYMHRIWVDLVSLDFRKNVWALGVIDEATNDIALAACAGKTPQAVCDAFIKRWVSLRGGLFSVCVSDAGKEFVSSETVEMMQKLGIFKQTTPAYASASHGKIERLFRTVRWTLDRVVADERKPRGFREWELLLCQTENSIRNEILHGGFSSSQRAWGRGTSMTVAPVDATAATDVEPETEMVRRVCELQDLAQEAHWKVRCDKAFSKMLHEQARPEVRQYSVGEVVLYRRPANPNTNKTLWKGPGIVAAYIPHGGGQYRVEHAGTLVSVHPLDIKGAAEYYPGEDKPVKADTEVYAELPAREEVPERDVEPPEARAVAQPENLPPQSKSEEKVEENVEQAIRKTAEKSHENQASEALRALKGNAADKAACVQHGSQKSHFTPPQDQKENTPQEVEKQDSVGPCGEGDSENSDVEEAELRRSERIAKKARQEFVSLLASIRESCEYGDYLADRKSFFEPVPVLVGTHEHTTDQPLSQLDAYGFSWDDLSEQARWEARQKGIADYDVSGSWDSTQDFSAEDLPAGAVRFTGRWVDSAKVIGGEIAGKSRWTPKGFMEKNPGKVDSPTATLCTHRVGEAMGLRRGWVKFKFDVSWAFFQSNPTAKNNLYILLPPELQTQPGTKLYRRLLREVPGTKGAPRAFFDTFREFLLGNGFVQSRVDKCLFHLPGKLFLTIHVDDGEGRGELEAVKFLESRLRERFALKDDGFTTVPLGESCEYCGIESVETASGTVQNQWKYVDSKLEPIDIDPKRARQKESWVTDEERKTMKSVLGKVRWVQRTHPEVSYELAKLSTWVAREDCNVGDLQRANKLVRVVQKGFWRQVPHETARQERGFVHLPRLDLSEGVKVVCVVDAGEPKDERGYNGKWHGGFLVGLMHDSWDNFEGPFVPLYFRSGHVTRVAHSSFDGETLIGIEGLDFSMAVALLVEEFESGVRPGLWDRKLMQLEGVSQKPECEIAIELHSDSEDLVSRVRKITNDPSMSKRRKTDIADFQECEELGVMRPIVKIKGPRNPVDCFTKQMSFESVGYQRMCELVRDGVYRVIM